MTPEPALWNWRSRGLESGGASKKRRKKGSSSRGLRWPGCSLMVPRVAILTTAGEVRLTMGASDGIGAASRGAGKAATAGAAADPAMKAAASHAAANLRRRFIPSPILAFDLFSASETRPDELTSGPSRSPSWLREIATSWGDITRKTAPGAGPLGAG